jgi:hypothetical protein
MTDGRESDRIAVGLRCSRAPQHVFLCAYAAQHFVLQKSILLRGK